MSNIEPTEEQKQAANAYLDKHVHITISNTNFERVADVVARLLAEREAKLREEVATLNANNDQLVRDLKLSGFCYPASNVARFIVHDRLESSGDWYDPATSRIMHMDPAKAFAMKDEIDTLRARVAQAESAIDIFVANDDKCDTLLRRTGLDGTVNVVPRLAALVDETVALRARVAELEAVFAAATNARVADTMVNLDREAQHLADIKALRKRAGALSRLLHVDLDDECEPTRIGFQTMEALRALDEGIASTAHYDDAKAAEGGEG